MEAGISTAGQSENARPKRDESLSETEAIPSKPWASGRTLTPAQRERKRALDRLSHRERRGKVQSRIAELEGIINALLEERAGKVHATEAGAENHVLRTASQGVNQVPALAFASSNPQEFVPHAADIFSFNDNINYGSLDYVSTVNETDALNSNNEGASATPQGVLASDVGQPFHQLPVGERLRTETAGIAVSPLQSVIQRDSISTTRLCNMELYKANRLNPNQVCGDELANQEAIITAVLQGWEEVEGRSYVCPLWSTLHRIDDILFCRSNTMTRLVMLYTIHRMLLCRVKARPVTDLPRWYRPRPAQCRFQHEAVMGYFAWPGLRERLVLSDKPILGELFWDAFAKYFCFNWPYELSNAYDINPAGQVHFSGAFLNYLHDIRHWQMDHRFYAEFPEISNDIYPAPELPMRITFPGSSMMAGRERPVSTVVESEEDVAPGDICDAHSSLANSAVPVQNLWNFPEGDLAMDTAPAWDPAIDGSSGGLSS